MLRFSALIEGNILHSVFAIHTFMKIIDINQITMDPLE